MRLVSTVVAAPVPSWPLPFRLRTALGVLLVCGVAATAVPRLRAAARFFNLVGKVADYGLCMAGPTGATALRDDPARFRQLVRRRLVGADASARPFAACSKAATEISGQTELGASYELAASEYLEWGAGDQQHSINSLLRVLPDLPSLHAASWPFVRKPLSELIRPSRGAYQGEHALELAQPTAQQGLVIQGSIVGSTLVTPKGHFVVLSNQRDAWALRSRDGGRHWTPTSVWQDALAGHAHHCVRGDGQRFALAARGAGEPPALTLGSDDGVSAAERLQFGTVTDQVMRVACDDTGAVILTRRAGEVSHHVYSCVSGAGCSELGLPPTAQQRGTTVDVARVARVNVMVWAREGLVRVSTARDRASVDGTRLVFDARGTNTTGLGTNVEAAIFGFGRQLMLSLSSRDKPTTRWALVADGPSAAFRAP